MKKIFTKFLALLALLLIGGGNSAWAEEVVLASFSNTSNEGWTITGSPSYSSSGGYQLVASTMSITSPSINFSGYKDINITITCRKYGGPDATQGKISVKQGSTSGTELTTYSPSKTSLTSSGALAIKPSADAALVIYCPGASSSKGCGISNIVIKGTKIATESYTVNFNAGENGSCSTSSLTEISAGAGVTLPSCTANAGYKFLGWTATQEKTTIDTGLTAGSTYKPSANTTLYAVYGALYQVTIEEPANGTLTVTYGENDVTSGSYYAKGEKINIVATPNDGYKFRNIQVVDATTHTFTASNEKEWEMGDHNITISANFDEIVYRTITWSVNGNTSDIAPTQVENGTNITFPTGLADIYGKKFMGWSAKEDASSATDLVSGDVAASADATYYAVFADFTQGSEETVTLACNEKSVNSAYTTFTRTDSEGNTWNLYAVISKQAINNTDHYYYQLNSNANGYKISSPVFAGNVKSVKAWVWNTSGKETRSSYLCSSTETAQPTSGDLGSLSVAPSTKNSEMTFALDDEKFTQFNIYTSATIGFEKIEVTYGEDDVIENYTTKPVPTFASLDDLIAADESFDAVNVTINDNILASMANSGMYVVVLANSEVRLASAGEDRGWLAGGHVTGTLTNVIWNNTDKVLMSQESFWSDLEYTAPVVLEFASIDELLAANLASGTTVTVTVEGTITEVRAVKDGPYAIELDNKLSIGAICADRGWKVGGTVTGKLVNVNFGTGDNGEPGVASLSDNIFENLTYVAPAEPTNGTIDLKAEGRLPYSGYEDIPVYFATFSSDKDVFIPESSDGFLTSVYTVFTDGEELMLEELGDESFTYEDAETGLSGYYVPANNGVILTVMFEEGVEHTIPYYTVENVEVSPLAEDNMLRPASQAKETDGSYKFYMLAYGDEALTPSTLGFYYGADNGKAFDSRVGSAYLAVPTPQAAKGFTFVGGATGIKNVNKAAQNNVMFNLAGQRVLNANGIVIKNGKKFVK